MKLLNGVGLGTYPLSNVFTPVQAERADGIVKTFIEMGGRYIQTAPYYEGVEPLLGNIFRGVPRQDYFLCTLCVKNRQGERKGSEEALIAQCDDSLKQLGLDYIDLYMTSTTKADDASLAETMWALHRLKEAGKIRNIGVCNVTLEQLRQYNGDGHVQYVQNRASMLNWGTDADFEAYCHENGIGLIPWGIIERGLLTDKVVQGFTLRDSDFRRKKKEFRDEAVGLVRSWVTAELKPIADSAGIPTEALVIWWTMHQPSVAMCVTGATSEDQVRRNMSALEVSLDKSILKQIDEARQRLEETAQERHGVSVVEFLGNVYG